MKTDLREETDRQAGAETSAGRVGVDSARAKSGIRREVGVAVTLIACIAAVAFWEVMANRRRAPFQPFELTAEDFADFQPHAAGWSIRQQPVGPDPVEPNILVYKVISADANPLASRPGGARAPGIASGGSGGGMTVVRLVHGYNMVDCMRIKGYEAELLREIKSFQASNEVPGRVQVWRLRSGSGAVSIWVSSMLRSGDFAELDMDVRDMPFPRIGIPDDPRWLPRGITWRSLRHPVRNLRWFLRAKWNNSRCDLATFLGLRRPAWASDDLLTLVAASSGRSVRAEEEERVMEETLRAHALLYAQLREWKRAALLAESPFARR